MYNLTSYSKERPFPWQRNKMAGECLSYGAFGPYSTLYERTSHYDYPKSAMAPRGKGSRLTESWTNFLPHVTPFTAEDPHASKPDSPYDHEAHAGLKEQSSEVTWVVKRYTPLDERTYAPVPRYKYMLRPTASAPPRQWIPPRQESSNAEISKFSRQRNEQQIYSSTPHTRDERWSTLRETLPSNGRAVRMHPPDWGSRGSKAPKMSGLPQRRFPIIQSPMSRFVSDMHLTNREFKLF